MGSSNNPTNEDELWLSHVYNDLNVPSYKWRFKNVRLQITFDYMKNVIDYNRLRLQITITPCLTAVMLYDWQSLDIFWQDIYPKDDSGQLWFQIRRFLKIVYRLRTKTYAKWWQQLTLLSISVPLLIVVLYVK